MTPSDRIRFINKFKTLRLKQPTVDLMYTDKKLNAINAGVLDPVPDVDANMEQEMIHEMDVAENAETSTITLKGPRERSM